MFGGSRGKRGNHLVKTAYGQEVLETQVWFREHVTLAGEPYTLDPDQVKAVVDNHKNTLVTARAGSGKTRVIVAKIAYLVAKKSVKLDEIAAFMFNRTAAAEVNQRIGSVLVDGKSLLEISGKSSDYVQVASTFHKYALDLLKSHGEHPVIITATAENELVTRAFDAAMHSLKLNLAPKKRQEYFAHATQFVVRAGQKYFGESGLARLKSDLSHYISRHQSDLSYAENLKIHQLCVLVYQNYLKELQPPQTNFNRLISRAVDMLSKETAARDFPTITKLKFLLVDEYQDFSDLFFAMITALRSVASSSKLFVVGDDWQAINRFAGSDVSYFVNFRDYFPEDSTNIPLMTNYRSRKTIVEHANDFMLKSYDQTATRAVAFNQKRGLISHLNYDQIKFDPSDFYEDQLGDAKYQLALAEAYRDFAHQQLDSKFLTHKLLPLSKLLKTLAKIAKKHHKDQFMLLHRHNFTSEPKISLEMLFRALEKLLISESILTPERFQRQFRCMTIHKSKGLESDIVVLLEANQDIIAASHPHANLFQILGDNPAAEIADRHRLLYVALTRAKEKLYILSKDRKLDL